MLNSAGHRLNAEVAEQDAESAEEDVERGRGIDSRRANMAKQVGFHRILKWKENLMRNPGLRLRPDLPAN